MCGCLLQAVGMVVADPEAGMILMKQLAVENTKGVCQEALPMGRTVLCLISSCLC